MNKFVYCPPIILCILAFEILHRLVDFQHLIKCYDEIFYFQKVITTIFFIVGYDI